MKLLLQKKRFRINLLGDLTTHQNTTNNYNQMTALFLPICRHENAIIYTIFFKFEYTIEEIVWCVIFIFSVMSSSSENYLVHINSNKRFTIKAKKPMNPSKGLFTLVLFQRRDFTISPYKMYKMRDFLSRKSKIQSLKTPKVL